MAHPTDFSTRQRDVLLLLACQLPGRWITSDDIHPSTVSSLQRRGLVECRGVNCIRLAHNRQAQMAGAARCGGAPV